MSFDLKTQIQPPIIIVGLARSGMAAQKLLLACGFTEADIITYDERKPEAKVKSELELEKLTQIKTAVISPGVSLQKSFIQDWRKQGVHITSELSLALSQVTDEKIIGITGSLGKSTTTSTVGAGILSFDAKAFIGGNLGTPFCEYALSVRNSPQTKAKWIVLELSSYQLENAEHLNLDFGMITYLSPNHLERYDSLQNYYETKWSLVERTKEKVILNENGGDLRSFAARHPSSKLIWSHPKRPDFRYLSLENSKLIGRHNQDNLAMAAALGLECGFPASYFTLIKSFGGLKHRLEFLGEKHNTVFINDSKATSIDSVKAAVEATVESFPNFPITLLLGGRDKKLPWEDLKYLATHPMVELVFFGEHGRVIKTTLESNGDDFKTMKEMLYFLAEKNPKEKSVVLLSPGGVSQDEFSSFEARGDFFRSWFDSLS